MEKKSSPAVEKLDSENRKSSDSKNPEKLSSAGDLAAKKVKKLDDVKDSSENKAAIAEAEGTLPQVPSEAGKVEDKVEKKKEESKPAVEKVSKHKKGETKVELEREYIVPLKKGVLNVPHYRRAKKAVKVLKEFMVRHMKVRDRDLNKVKVDINLNNEIWFRGIKKPMNKVKVKAKKIDGIVYVELAEIPAVVGFKIAREAKARALAVGSKKSVVGSKKKEESEKEDKDGDGVADKKEEKEDKAAGAEKAAKVAKVKTGAEKHTAQGKHMKKTMPVRKSLKK